MGRLGEQARAGLGRTAKGQTCSGQKVADSVCPRVNYKMPPKDPARGKPNGGNVWDGWERVGRVAEGLNGSGQNLADSVCLREATKGWEGWEESDGMRWEGLHRVRMANRWPGQPVLE